MKLTVIGDGYIGLITAACFAEMGNEVICVGQDEDRIAALDSYRLPLYEPGLEDLIRRNCQGRRLFFSTDLPRAVAYSRICYLTLSPEGLEVTPAELEQIYAVAAQIGRCLNDYKIIVNKAALPIGTAARLREIIAAELRARGVDIPFEVAVDPEFVKQGTAIEDFMRPERIIIGCDNGQVAELLQELYAPFVRTNRPVIVMDPVSAELIKYAANAFLATKISFINELARLCAGVGADINAIRRGLGSDPRIGPLFLFPGLGYGGVRFSQGVRELIKTAQNLGWQPDLLTATDKVNRRQLQYFLNLIKGHFAGQLTDRTLGIWGLAFKPWTDDIREAPALTVVRELLAAGAKLKIYDPQAVTNARRLLGEGNQQLRFAADMYEAAAGADGLVINTDWTMFRTPDFERLRGKLRQPVIFDGRNLYNPKKLSEAGFSYYYIGKPGTPGRPV